MIWSSASVVLKAVSASKGGSAVALFQVRREEPGSKKVSIIGEGVSRGTSVQGCRPAELYDGRQMGQGLMKLAYFTKSYFRKTNIHGLLWCILFTIIAVGCNDDGEDNMINEAIQEIKYYFRDAPGKEIIETYALRWLIENNIQENIDFFSLNALSSPVIVKVDFDIAMTLIANTLYKTLAHEFKLFDNAKPKTLYRNIIEGKANISITSDRVNVKFGKKAFNPMIMDWVRSLPEIQVPWMNNKFIEYSFE